MGRVAQHLRGLGYRVEVEKPVGGGRTIDLVASIDGQDVAIEIESEQSDVEENVRKCLAAEYQRVIVVPSSRNLAPTIWRRLRASEGLPLHQVKLQDVQAFLLNRNQAM